MVEAEQSLWTSDAGWTPTDAVQGTDRPAQLVFLFGGAGEVRASDGLNVARRRYPGTHVVGCSTAGEIHGTAVKQQSVVMTALSFATSTVAVSRVPIGNSGQSRRAGEDLIRALPPANLRHVFLLSEGLLVSASDMVRGATSALRPGVTLTGGFAGDGDCFQATHVWCDSEPERPAAMAVGFYGDRLRVSAAVTGPWGPFGPERLITRSKGNVLYELDGHSALSVYRAYLGEYASALPASGLLFPLLIHPPDSSRSVLRSLLGVDEAEQSITFGGDVEEGSYARLLRGSIEHLIAGALETAQSLVPPRTRPPGFALLVSCNGRRHVLKQRLDEEIEAVREAFGPGSAFAGFYSYGEIGPAHGGGPTELHNESMTITAFSED